MVILENKADFQNFRNILDEVKKIGPNLNRNSLVLIILYILIKMTIIGFQH